MGDSLRREESRKQPSKMDDPLWRSMRWRRGASTTMPLKDQGEAKKDHKGSRSIIILVAERARAKKWINRRRFRHDGGGRCCALRPFVSSSWALGADASCFVPPLPLLLPRSILVDWVDGQSVGGSHRGGGGLVWSGAMIAAQADQEAADRSRGLVGPSSSGPAGTDTDTSISGQGWRPALV